MEVKTYSPKMVVMTFGGTVVNGWNTISIERSSPSFRMVKGIRGANTRVRTGDTSAVVTITVPQTSDINNIFNQIVVLDEATGNGRIQVTIVDVVNGDTFISSEGFLEGSPKIDFDSSSGDRVWKLNCLSSQTTETGSGWNVGSLIDRITSIF